MKAINISDQLTFTLILHIFLNLDYLIIFVFNHSNFLHFCNLISFHYFVSIWYLYVICFVVNQKNKNRFLHAINFFYTTIFYCQLYTIGLNTNITTYSIQYHTNIESVTDNKCVSIYDIEKFSDDR